MRKLIITGYIISLSIILGSCINKQLKNNSADFSFVFMTDIHIQPEANAPEGFKQAMDSINKLNPSFVITGGDLIMDALGQKYSRADSLYTLYNSLIKNLKMPVYNTMGNHEYYGLYKESNADPSNPDYGEKMFENKIGKSYFSFVFKGWKFIIINSVEATKNHSYIGWVDSTQIEWIRNELKNTSKETPIVLSTHVPFITAFMQRYYGSTIKNDSSLVIANSKEVLDLFQNYNLKLVLQGHLHTVEDIYIDGIHFITGGAVSGGWWKGPNKEFEEGFMQVTIIDNDIKWVYKDYGWNVKRK